MSETIPPSSGKDVPDRAGHISLLDGLRGLAALSVLLCHYANFFFLPGQSTVHPDWWTTRPGADWLGPIYPQGMYAVNVFWIISGFVLAHVYLGAKTGTKAFAVHRFARLYPLHLVTLLVMAGLQLLALQRFGTWIIYDHNDWLHFVEQLLFASGWGIDKHVSFNGPIWSVSVELLVYALFWVLRDWLHHRGLVAALAMSIGAGMLVLIGIDWLMFACSLHFFFGTAIAMAWRQLQARRQLAKALAAVLLALGIPLLQSSNQAVFTALGINAFFGGLILLLASLEDRAPQKLRQASQWLGDASYGTYLWHLPFTVFLLIAFADRIDFMKLASHGWFLIAWLGAMLALGRLSYTYLEYPSRVILRRLMMPPGKVGDRHSALA